MTVEGLDDEMVAGPSNSQPGSSPTPKLGPKDFDKKLCYAPPRKIEKTKTELSKTLLPVLESPMSSPAHERGPSQDVFNCSSWTWASMHLTKFKAHSRMRT